jgi:glycosyltransferase involved in cell wall biosynthesis
MRIAICTDAWQPRTSGVVTTLTRQTRGLAGRGHEVLVIPPGLFRTVPCPTYPDIRLSLLPGRRLGRLLDDFRPQAVAVPAEGPLGLAARNHCLRRGWPFPTAFMTRFPDYVRLRSGVPEAWTFRALRWFHRPAAATMVSSPSLREELTRRGFANLRHWGRGVDTELFRPRGKGALALPRPIAMYMGRVAVEKNLDAFLSLPLAGSKVVIGDGPALEAMRRRYPQAHFPAARPGWTSPCTWTPPTCSSSPAARTPSASCSSRPWPAGCPWRPIPCPARATWWPTAAPAGWTRTWAAPWPGP